MYPEIKNLLYQAEERYLKPLEIELFRRHAQFLAQRLETYELLREQEVAVFQPVADRLLEVFPQEKQETLEQALKHWLSVWRYCAMALLLDSPEFLQRHLLEWLSDMVQAHQLQAIEQNLYQLLQAQLPEFLSQQQLALLQPFLARAEATLLGTNNLTEFPA